MANGQGCTGSAGAPANQFNDTDNPPHPALLNDQSKVEEDTSLIEFDNEESIVSPPEDFTAAEEIILALPKNNVK